MTASCQVFLFNILLIFTLELRDGELVSRIRTGFTQIKTQHNKSENTTDKTSVLECVQAFASFQ